MSGTMTIDDRRCAATACRTSSTLTRLTTSWRSYALPISRMCRHTRPLCVRTLCFVPKRICARTHMRTYTACACVRACMRTYVRACARACLHESSFACARARGRGRVYAALIYLCQADLGRHECLQRRAARLDPPRVGKFPSSCCHPLPAHKRVHRCRLRSSTAEHGALDGHSIRRCLRRRGHRFGCSPGS